MYNYEEAKELSKDIFCMLALLRYFCEAQKDFEECEVISVAINYTIKMADKLCCLYADDVDEDD